MPAPGALSVGRAVTPTTGSNQLALARSGQLLGFWSNATQAITFYDSASASTPGAAVATITACAIGWNPLPLDFVNGIVVNLASAGFLVVV
jgi:hypothetical protein